MHADCRSLAFALCVLLAFSTNGHATVSHPMDPLEDTEILAAANILLAGHAAQPGAIFQSIELREPPKDVVLAFHPGDPITRAAQVFYRQNKQSYKTIVDLTHGTFTPPVLIPKSDGQLGLTITEVSDFSFAFQNPQFLQALARRGLTTPDQLSHVLVQPLTAGSFGLPEENRRIVKAQMLYTEGAGINLFARPIEGVQAIIDLDDQVVLDVRDTGVVPVPAQTHDFDEVTVASRYGLRPALKPLTMSQPQGANFTMTGNFVEWQKWRFHVRFERRAGTIVSLVTYDGRPVLYQGSLAEIFVPYQDPDANWFYKTYMDAGEFGLGLLSSPLALGLDVPSNAVLLNALVSAAIPDPSVPVVPLPLSNVVGVFERLTGNPAWRHFELFSGGLYEGRAEVELVVRSISQVGNYDYMIDWILSQNGVIRVEVGLTGIDAGERGLQRDARRPDGVQAKRNSARWSRPTWSRSTTVTISTSASTWTSTGATTASCWGNSRRRNLGNNPRKSVWVVDEQRLGHERDAQLDDNELDLARDQSQPSQRARLQHRLHRRVARQRGAAVEESRLQARAIHRSQPVDHRLRSGRALCRWRHAQPESGRAWTARLRSRITAASSTPTSCCG